MILQHFKGLLSAKSFTTKQCKWVDTKKHNCKLYKVNIYRLFANLHDKTVKYTKYVLCIF